MKPKLDYELEVLLDLHGHEFDFAKNFVVKYEVRRVTATKGRPSGIKYSLTLHDPKGKRIYGIDNAHKARRRREFDHGVRMDQPSSLLTNIAARRSCLKTSSEKSSES